MRRSLKIVIGAALLCAIWFIGISNETVSSTNKLLIPFMVLVALGLISLGSILWRVKNLQEHPNQRISLEKDIENAKQFYESKGFKFKIGKQYKGVQ